AARRSESRLRGYRIAGWLACLMAVGSLFMGVAAPGVVLLGLGIAALVYARSWRRQVVLRHQLRFVGALLAVLREDVAPAARLRLRLDVRGGTIKAKQIETRPPLGGRGTYPKVAETVYGDPWCVGETHLIDGSALTWRVMDRIRRRRVTKKSPS